MPDYSSSANVRLIACDVFKNSQIDEEMQKENTNNMHQRYSLKLVLEKVYLSVNAALHFFVAMINKFFFFLKRKIKKKIIFFFFFFILKCKKVFFFFLNFFFFFKKF